MNTFNVDGKSALVSNMAVEATEMEEFPVLIGTEIAYFHRVGGGYDSKRGVNVVNFIHEIQGNGSPNHIDPDQSSHNFEAHLDNYYNLNVSTIRSNPDEYPDENYIVSVRVDNFMSGEYSFSEELNADIDKRPTRFKNE